MKKFYLLLGLLAGGTLAQAQTTCTTTVSTFPYLQNFETGAGGWVAGGANSSWALGTPAKTIINSAASGTNAWITGLTGTYNASEQSFVEGPCFNLTTLVAPIFEMKIWWNSEFSWDGAVLQSSTDGGVTWQVVGTMGDPNNWYTDNSINGAPGGQPAASAVGWTGRNSTSNGSGGWVTAKHALTGLGGNANVRLRIAFGSDGSIHDEGVAFDDVRVYESPANDLQVTALTLPNSGCNLAASTNVCITVKNLGSATASNIPVSYTINGGTPVTATMPGPIASGATAQFCFPTAANFSPVGTYNVVGTASLSGDFDPTNNSMSGTVISVPSVSTFPYFQNFENGNGGWIAGGTNSSWALGTPAKPVINSAASGTNAWTTSLTGTYNASENSQVVGPCFNLSSLIAPIIEMKVWWNSEAGWDGAVLQSSIDGGTTWQNVGAFGDPNNWYNDNSLDNRPGNSMEGWAGRVSSSNGSNSWVTAKHVLTGLGGQSSVRLRIAFGSDGSVMDDGFAFDDVRIFDTPANDAGVVSITSPTTPIAPNVSVPVTVTIKNFGTSNLTGATMGFSVNGVTVVNNVPFTGNLPLNQTSAAITLGNYTFPAGTYTLKAWTRLPNGATDGDNFNDTMRVSLISCTALTGTYTINKNAVPSATNFPSVALAAQAISSCGVSGPVTFNVVANSGPYSELVELGIISGASATNTITFEGNGNILTAMTSTAKLGVITFNGADFVKFNNFVINVDPTAGNASAVHFMNASDNNTISNSTLNIPLASTSSTVNGITTGTTVSSAGNNTNGSKFINNVINGGYYAIRLNGNTNGVDAANNQITGNTFKDSYIYNIYLSNTSGTLIENNNISRPSRTNVSTFYGVYATGINTGMVISRNRIHNTHDAATSLTGSVYGIYLTGADAPVGSENIIKNNLIYNINSTGTIYALYNSSSDGAHYYHNTIDINTPNGTSVIRGFYQITSATNIKFVNNIITISGGTGAKHALYFGTTASTIISNNNDLYAPGGTVGYYGVDFATLALWQTANNNAYDQASVSVDPIYVDVATGNLMPTSVAVNNIGQPTPVTNDILGSPRSTTTPDLGAYEFTLNPNDVGVSAVSGAASGCGLSGTQVITATIKNYGTATQTSVPVSLWVNGTNLTPTPEVWTGTLAPNGTATHTFAAKANLATAGQYVISAVTSLTGDLNAGNNADTLIVTNALMAGLPALNFETSATGINATRVVTNSKSAVSESTAASSPLTPTSTKGMVMEGGANAAWQMPVGVTDPWTSNPDHFSAIYMCFSPAGGNPTDPLWLSFDLKQLFKTANANTNFRVTVNGTAIGGNTTNNSPANTYRPPFTGTGGTTNWTRIALDLSAYKNLPNIEIGFESSVADPFANGTGTANLIDNIVIARTILGVKDNQLQSAINVYPNPSNGVFSVSVPTTKVYTLEVTDLTGRVVKKEVIRNNNTAQLDLKGQAQGVYMLKITSEGATAIQKLIVE